MQHRAMVGTLKMQHTLLVCGGDAVQLDAFAKSFQGTWCFSKSKGECVFCSFFVGSVVSSNPSGGALSGSESKSWIISLRRLEFHYDWDKTQAADLWWEVQSSLAESAFAKLMLWFLLLQHVPSAKRAARNTHWLIIICLSIVIITVKFNIEVSLESFLLSPYSEEFRSNLGLDRDQLCSCFDHFRNSGEGQGESAARGQRVYGWKRKYQLYSKKKVTELVEG